MLTEEQKFIFDLKGYLVIPEALDPDLVKRLKDQINTLENDPESLPPHERELPGGAFAELIDHPMVMNILDFAIHRKREKLRLESTFYTIPNSIRPDFHRVCKNISSRRSPECILDSLLSTGSCFLTNP